MARITLFSRTRSFWFGLTLPWKALRQIISKPKLFTLSVIPVGLTLALYVIVLIRVQSAARDALLHWMTQQGWVERPWLITLSLIVAKVLLFILGAVTFSFASSIVACPFNDLLAEHTEKVVHPPLPPVGHQSFGKKVGLIWVDILKTLAATLATLLALVLSWVPGLNLVVLVIACLLVTFQYTSYPQTRREQGIGYGLRFLVRHFFACFGFGLSFSFLFAIPILASLCLPLAVVGGTLLVSRAQPAGDASNHFRLR